MLRHTTQQVEHSFLVELFFSSYVTVHYTVTGVVKEVALK